MQKNNVIPSIICTTVCFFSMAKAFAIDFSPIINIDPSDRSQYQGEVVIDLNKQSSEPETIVTLTPTDTFSQFANATDRFVQCNVRASWTDFKTLINNNLRNDFVYLSIANKMSDLGLFDLANLASSKTQDSDLSKISIDDMKKYYFPRKKLKTEDEIFLAEIYSNIIYNDQSSEATNELLKNEALLSNSDYANYLVALGSYKSNFYSRANKYIDLAIMQNPSNLNYKKLKAEILVEDNKPTEAIKLVSDIKKQNLYSYEYDRKVSALEQYILYKTTKADWKKNYHLGYYHYLENDDSKAIKTLQTALSASKKRGNSAEIYALMSEIYLDMNEFEKSTDAAKKAYKINTNLPKSLISLGDLSYRNKNYKQALSYYKQAASEDKISYIPLVKEAKTYQKLSNTKKAKEIYLKILKTHFDCWEAYYNIALLDKDKEIIYLKKALAVNLMFKDGWIDLARIEIERSNYDIAQKYLSNAFYIDENDFRYYYYQGLVSKNLGDYVQAEYNFKKCLKLNPNFKEAQKELNPTINI